MDSDLTEKAIRLAQLKARQNRHLTSSLGSHEPIDATETSLHVIQEALNGYEIVERIDQGGQGIVYKAIEAATRRVVAIKVLRDGSLSSRGQRERFAREIAVIARMRHPNIVAFYHSRSHANLQFFIMEYIDGIPIDEYVVFHRPSVSKVVELVIKICSAVHSAHQQAVIHRDLKPGNILVDFDGEPHILDFGLAKDIDVEGASVNRPLSMAGQLVGTLPYSSPEQAGGDGEAVDIRSDVYSLGVILYQLLTGSMPYPIHGSSAQVRDNILTREPESIRQALARIDHDKRWTSGGVPNDLERVLFKALNKDKAKRYQSAEAFGDDLNRFLRGDAVTARAHSNWYLLRKMLYRHRLVFGFSATITLLVLGASIGLALLYRHNERIARTAQAGISLSSVLKLGGVTRDLGRADDGAEMLEKVAELSKGNSSDDPLLNSASFYANRGLALIYYEEDPDLAQRYCDEATRIAEVCAGRDPTNPVYQRQLAQAYYVRAKGAVTRGQFDNGIELFSKSEMLWRRLVQQNPDKIHLERQLAGIINERGICFQNAKCYNDCIDSHLEAYDILNSLPDDPRARTELLVDLLWTEGLLAAAHLSTKAEQDDHVAGYWLNRARARLKDPLAKKAAINHAFHFAKIVAGIEANEALFAKRVAPRQSKLTAETRLTP